MRILELHILQSFPVTCLNRDDMGAPKSAFFGGSQRARISSQCLKRAIREYAKELQREFFGGIRTRYIVESLEDRLRGAGKDPDLSKNIALLVADALGKLDSKEKGNVKTLLFFSPGEFDHLVKGLFESGAEEVWTALSDGSSDKKTLDNAKKELKKIIGKAIRTMEGSVKDAADIAIFGRMVADDHSLMVEAAGLFSHALSTHAVASDIDFFAAVDEFKPEDVEGAGHIGTLEFNSACYYRYVGLNMDLLFSKHLRALSKEDQSSILDAFIRSSILAVPMARKNSMSGFTLPAHVLGTLRKGAPLSLANAFETPVVSKKEGYISPSVEKMKAHYDELKKTYELSPEIEVSIPEVPLSQFVKEMTGFIEKEGVFNG